MNTKLCSLLAGVALVAFAGAANAAEPMVLSNGQMDGITAGAAANANAAALALGDFDAFTQTVTATNSVTTLRLTNPDGTVSFTPGIAIGQSYAAAAAASALFQAAVAVSANSAAQLP